METETSTLDPRLRKVLKGISREEAAYLLSDIEGYQRPLVDINQFIEDKIYMGSILTDEYDKTKLYSIWKDALNKIFPNPYYSPYYEIAFSGSIGTGKCLSGSTRVPTSIGLLTLEELNKEFISGVKFQTITETGLNDVLEVIDNGFKPVLKVTTASGKVLIPTKEHKFRVLSSNFEIEWKRAGDLNVGDYLVSSRECSPFGSEKLEKGLAYLMGVLIGDGSFAYTNKNTSDRSDIRLTVGHKTYEEESDFMEEVTYLFHKYIGFSVWRPTKLAYYIGKINHDFCNKMTDWNSWSSDYIKNIPSIIYRSRQKDIIDFIAGLIDTDGHVSDVNIDLCFKSESLIDGLISLFSAMGVQTKKSIRVIKDKNYWRVQIVGNASFRRLYELGLNLRISYKQEGFKKLVNRSYHMNERTIIPYARDYIKGLRREWAFPRGSKINNLFGAAYNNQNVTLETLKKIDECLEPSANATVRYLIDHDVYLDPVVDIQDNGVVEHTYDLSCNGSPSYRVEGIISHNSTVGRIILMYDLYKLLMLRNPFSKYQLIASDAIVLALFTANLNLAKMVLYRPFRELVKSSPFFVNRLTDKKTTEEGTMLFPNNISIEAGSRFTHALGLAVFSGLLDEASFQQEGENTHQAYDSYLAMSRRMKSRFMELGGGTPGHLVLISSKKNENAFLEKHISESKNDPNFICFEYPLWEAQRDKGIYSGVTFRVFAGTPMQSPRILNDDNKTKYPADKILDVPIEYKKEFETNIEKALMDLAGTVAISTSKYIAFPENLRKAIRIVHCCTVSEHIMLDFFDEKRIIEYIDVQKLKLYLNLLDNSPRYIHIDIGVTDDSYGFAMSCVSGMREVEKFDVQELMEDPTSTGMVMRNEPVIRTELALSIKGTTRVPLWKVRDFIVDLTELGFPIVMVTADTFQSEDTLQLLTKMGYETDYLSLDKSKEPHITFRNALYEGRAELPDFPLMTEEFTALVDKGKKFDHPTEGTKDITDAVVGSHYTAFKHSGSFIDVT